MFMPSHISASIANSSKSYRNKSRSNISQFIPKKNMHIHYGPGFLISTLSIVYLVLVVITVWRKFMGFLRIFDREHNMKNDSYAGRTKMVYHDAAILSNCDGFKLRNNEILA
jgi:hypothetical protein